MHRSTARTPKKHTAIRPFLQITLILAVAACSGGGGSDDTDPPALDSMESASRFLAQASLGAPLEEIERVEAIGPEEWIEEQMALPVSSHLETLRALRDRYGDAANPDTFISPAYRRFAWWKQVIQSDDVLRQRVALALSEIFVISDQVDVLFLNPESVASYYDVLMANAFGRYDELLRDVTLHPAMGIYLSHLNNDRSDANLGRFPDENYAREIMQLFSIGLFELRPDGSVVEDANGQPLATYSNADITELAKVFTGLGLQGPASYFGGMVGSLTLPMVMYPANHEPGPKLLPDGSVIPDGQPAIQDVEDALEFLASHPNVGPFIGRRLIQRLVTSNPSAAYIGRVSAVFANDGTGQRGNLGAVVRAILTDSEARSYPPDEAGGRLREPFLRWVSLLRAFDARSASGEVFVEDAPLGFLMAQLPMASPTVFNFFQPDYAPSGAIRERGLVAPEFQITTDGSVVSLANLATFFAFDSPAFPADVTFFRSGTIDEDEIPMLLDLDDEQLLALDVDRLIDRLDLILTYGSLSSASREAIREALGPLDPSLRVPMALHLFLISPDYAVVD